MVLNYVHWNPDPELVNILGISVRYYGLLFVGGLVLSVYVLGWIYKREGIPLGQLEKLTIFGMVGILAGARLGHCLFYEPAYYLSHPLEMIFPIAFTPAGELKFIGYQGLASHGGALGLLIALYLYSRKTKIPMLHTVDLIAIVSGLGAGFIRLANFANSEIIGTPTEKPWGVIFEKVDHLPRHPAQLYEAMAYFSIFAIMVALYKKMGIRAKNGLFFGLALVLIFSARVAIELVKENQAVFEEGMVLNMGQLLSLPYVAVGLGSAIYGLRKTNRPETKSET